MHRPRHSALGTRHFTLLVLLTVPGLASAQRGTADSATSTPPLSVGVSAGNLHLQSGPTERALGGILQWQALPWLSVGTSPTYIRSATSTTNGTVVREGLADLPVSVGLSHDVRSGMTLGASLGVALPVSDTTSGVGTGRTSYEMDLAAQAHPTEQLSVSLGAGHPVGTTTDTRNQPTSIDAEARYQMWDRLATTLSYGNEVGGVDSLATLGQTLAGGLSLGVAGPWTLTVDGSHGIARNGAAWSASVGFGTAFGGLSPVSLTSPLRRLRRIFAHTAKGRLKTLPSKVCRVRICP